MQFKALNLSEALNKAVEKNNFLHASPIQEKAIPLIIEGKDLLVQAQTGSGKSAAFVLPILNFLQTHPLEGKAKIRVLVLAPTRELTLQIANVFRDFSSFMQHRPKVVSLIGAEGIGDQIYAIQQGCDILVATSGRFLDVVSKKQMNLDNVKFLVLDEADKMLNLDFEKELDAVLDELPSKRQNLFFSATYPEKILSMIEKISQDPQEVFIKEQLIVENIKQRVIKVNHENRSALLQHLLRTEKLGLVLVFMAKKRATDNLAVKFRKYGFLAESFHGDLTQEDRNFTLQEFKEKKIRILFSTDIAARGLDIEGIDTIINYDLPRSPSDYVHRIGRSARAGKSGVAISFIDYETQEHFKIIEKRAHIKLEREEIEGFELKGEAPKKVKGAAPVKGKKKSKKDKLREAAAKEAATKGHL